MLFPLQVSYAPMTLFLLSFLFSCNFGLSKILNKSIAKHSPKIKICHTSHKTLSHSYQEIVQGFLQTSLTLQIPKEMRTPIWKPLVLKICTITHVHMYFVKYELLFSAHVYLLLYYHSNISSLPVYFIQKHSLHWLYGSMTKTHKIKAHTLKLPTDKNAQ